MLCIMGKFFLNFLTSISIKQAQPHLINGDKFQSNTLTSNTWQENAGFDYVISNPQKKKDHVKNSTLYHSNFLS